MMPTLSSIIECLKVFGICLAKQRMITQTKLECIMTAHYDYDVYFQQCLLTNFIHNWLEERFTQEFFHSFEDTAINESKKTFNLTKSKTLQAKTFRYNKDFKVDNALDTKNKEPIRVYAVKPL